MKTAVIVVFLFGLVLGNFRLDTPLPSQGRRNNTAYETGTVTTPCASNPVSLTPEPITIGTALPLTFTPDVITAHDGGVITLTLQSVVLTSWNVTNSTSGPLTGTNLNLLIPVSVLPGPYVAEAKYTTSISGVPATYYACVDLIASNATTTPTSNPTSAAQASIATQLKFTTYGAGNDGSTLVLSSMLLLVLAALF